MRIVPVPCVPRAISPIFFFPGGHELFVAVSASLGDLFCLQRSTHYTALPLHFDVNTDLLARRPVAILLGWRWWRWNVS